MSYIIAKEKGYVPISTEVVLGIEEKTQPSAKGSMKWLRLVLGAVTLTGVLLVHQAHKSVDGWVSPTPLLKNQCAQVDVLIPNNTSPALEGIIPEITSTEYMKKSVEYLSGAVKIPTITNDGMGPPGVDDRWEIFYDFADYLKATFPLVHETLSVENVNTHGLVYTWKGSDSSLKPTLLLAHQDVVPVPAATVPTWVHPPFEGVFDGTFIWGRGSSDDKNQLIAIFESIELLLKAGFSPARTVLVSLGFDEEAGGYYGAGTLSTFLLERYGKDSVAVIIDEGMKMQKLWGTLVAQPGVAEKGAIDVKVVIRMPGGHSSVPPPHTSIGVLSELIQLIEEDTYPTYLDDLNPYYGTIICGAAHAPKFPKNLRKILSKEKRTSVKTCMGKDALAEEAAKESLFHKYLMTTSIAVDLISGGIKDNAIPEEATVVVNHRVNIGDSVKTVESKIEKLAKHIAEKHNLTLHAFDGETTSSSIMLSSPHSLDPAPVTPTGIDGISAWSVLSGTTRAQYGTDVVMAPGLMTGNTDTRYYWDLSRDIFRYGPGYSDDGDDVLGSIHTVNEKVSLKDHLETIKWFVMFIRNMDEAKLA